MGRKKLDNTARIEIRTSQEHKQTIQEIADKEHSSVTSLLLRIFDLYYNDNYK